MLGGRSPRRGGGGTRGSVPSGVGPRGLGGRAKGVLGGRSPRVGPRELRGGVLGGRSPRAGGGGPWGSVPKS